MLQGLKIKRSATNFLRSNMSSEASFFDFYFESQLDLWMVRFFVTLSLAGEAIGACRGHKTGI